MPTRVFTVSERARVREHLLARAQSDPRIIAGAAIGSDAQVSSDRWSDLDLTFGVADGSPLTGVLEDWTKDLVNGFDAVHLFDVSDRTTVYRVFLLPGNLQVDVSFSPGFVAEYGSRFQLLFGTAVKRDYATPISARDLFGIGVHHAVRARYCIERDRRWQAEYWISGVRDQALSLACHRHGLEASHGRGFDRLPRDVLDAASAGLVRSLERTELLRALTSSIELLIQQAEEVRGLAERLSTQLRDLECADWP